MSDLTRILQRMIRAEGPVSVSTYMGLALGHPRHGYYQRQDPFGAAGDFITAPEISQMFGELIGLWCVRRWCAMGRPHPFMLCELGPGRGTLMADALRAARVMPEFLNAARLHLVETSQALRLRQQQAIGRDIIWHESVMELAPLPGLIIANEFFDALPIRQFQRAGDKWHERMIALDSETGRFCFSLAPAPLRDAAMLPAAMGAAPHGAIAEICPAGRGIIACVAAQLMEHGGAALIIDYGPAESAPGDSFQAVRGHAYCDPLADPGHADVTAHVDFQSLAEAAGKAGCAIDGPLAQGRFLLQLGLAARAQRLAENASRAEQDAIRAAFHRLSDPGQMGGLFKAMALRHPGLGPSPGFEV